ncbi:hypothetical protein TOPH_00704 [Tolypocladium ophioglossoides CBS 100239]|uniref:Uncharacterized protein n=1 Tax=Tolypocladium ophioglossoides (strain CBS 100239) TaxID=1163406 RepID=A0A0L0NM39_TOLOC|nr:hypothetical protein TOPH_00704 [Tolypocladium ophioglossoides CBS 100239]
MPTYRIRRHNYNCLLVPTAESQDGQDIERGSSPPRQALTVVSNQEKTLSRARPRLCSFVGGSHTAKRDTAAKSATNPRRVASSRGF